MNNDELIHYGIIGMKWGTRRASTRSSNNKSASEKGVPEETRKRNIKKMMAITASAVTVAAAAYYVHKNPEAIGKVISKVKNVKVSDIGEKAINKGKEYIKEALSGAKEGAREALKEAPKKAAKVIVGGVILTQTKKILDSAVGKEESAKIFQANDNKKIGKFWKISSEDKDDDD